MDASLFSFSSIIWQKKKKDDISGSRRAADSGFVGALVRSSKWNRWEMDKKPPRLTCFLRRGRTRHRSHVQTLRGQTLSQKRRNFSSQGGKGPKYNNASITGQPTCSYDMYGKNDLALQLFFFFSPRQLLRFDFNAFCVVLYFHAKILLYLNVFILLNVLNFLVIIP